MAAGETSGISANELRNLLTDKLNRNGIKEKLQSQLRAKLFSELSLATKIRSKPGPEANLLLVKVVDSLFVEYLKGRGFEFSLSVFLPESGLESEAMVRVSFLIPRH